MITNVNLSIRDNLVDLIKERSELELIISYIYKLRFLNLALSYSIIYTNFILI